MASQLLRPSLIYWPATKCELPKCECIVNGLKCTDMCRLPDCDNQAASILNDEESSNEQDDELEDGSSGMCQPPPNWYHGHNHGLYACALFAESALATGCGLVNHKLCCHVQQRVDNLSIPIASP